MTAYFRQLVTRQLRPSLLVGLSLSFLSVTAQNGLIAASLLPGKKAWKYAVVFNSQIKTNLSFFSQAIGDTQLTVSLKGPLSLRPQHADREYTHICARFLAIDELRIPAPPSVISEVKQGLLEGFCFLQNRKGGIDSIFFRSPPADATEHIVIQLAEVLQYYNDPNQSSKRWSQVMGLSDGRLLADFRRVDSVNGLSRLILDSLVARQIRPSRQVELLPQYTRYRTRLSYVLDSSSTLPVMVDGFIDRESRINHRVASKLVNSYSFVRGKSIADTGICTGKIYKRALFYPERMTEFRDRQQKARADKIKPADLEAALRSITDSTSEQLQMNIGDDLKAFLASPKSSLSIVEEILLSSDPRGARFKLIRSALIYAATREAQDMLIKLIRQYRLRDPSLLRFVVPSVGLIAKPEYNLQTEMLELLTNMQVVSDRRGTILLALGNMAGQLSENNLARADSLVGRLSDLLQPVNDPMLLLAVLGNAGTKSALPFILPYLKDSSADIRSMAYYALRFIDDPAVEEIFRGALQDISFSDNRITAAILEASFYRSYQPAVSLLFEPIMENSDESLKLLYLQLICHHSYREAPLVELIDRVRKQYVHTAVGAAAEAFMVNAGL
ncbi:MAG: hypothetical protein JNL59_07165 [Chitinophagaceae bacterium]|nr:hypothetical protein [Chitinophagaceae bacterium]